MTLRHHLCRLCGASDDTFGCYERCTHDGPFHEWVPALEGVTWRRFRVFTTGDDGAMRRVPQGCVRGTSRAATLMYGTRLGEMGWG